MGVQAPIAGKMVKVPAEAFGWKLAGGREAYLDCLMNKNWPEMGLERAGRIIHHVQWQHRQNDRRC